MRARRGKGEHYVADGVRERGECLLHVSFLGLPNGDSWLTWFGFARSEAYTSKGTKGVSAWGMGVVILVLGPLVGLAL